MAFAAGVNVRVAVPAMGIGCIGIPTEGTRRSRADIAVAIKICVVAFFGDCIRNVDAEIVRHISRAYGRVFDAGGSSTKLRVGVYFLDIGRVTSHADGEDDDQ